MKRGYLEFLKNQKLYSNSKKEWNVVLLQTTWYWYDLVVKEHELCSIKKIKNSLANLKELVANSINKRFVYFITTRTKVRFSTTKKPVLFNDYFLVSLEVGIAKAEEVVKVDIPIDTYKEIYSDERLITLVNQSGEASTIDVHFFLQEAEINFGIQSDIKYIGLTKDPTSRPLFDGHKALSNIVYHTNLEEKDIFIYFNIFKVMTNAINSKFNARLIIPNAATDEVGVENEGRILEKCLILYFMAQYNIKNKISEVGELKNKLIKLGRQSNFEKLNFSIEVDHPSEYYKYSSLNRNGDFNHSFSCSVSDNDVEVKNIHSFV